jgi:flagellin-like hook-associated protein FlgL
LIDVRARLLALRAVTEDTAYDGLHNNLDNDLETINALLAKYNAVAFVSDTESDDERVDGLNTVSGQVGDAITLLTNRVNGTGTVVGGILAFGETVVAAPDETTRWAGYESYSLDYVSALEAGDDNGPALVPFITEPVATLLARIKESEPTENPEDVDPTAIDLTNDIESDLGVTDYLRIEGMIADLDRVLEQLDRVLAMLGAIQEQNNRIGALYSEELLWRPAPYWNTYMDVGLMTGGIASLRTSVSQVRTTLAQRLSL